MARRREQRGADEPAPVAYGEGGRPRGFGEPEKPDPERIHDPDLDVTAGDDRAPQGRDRGDLAAPIWAPAEKSEGVVFLSSEQFEALVRAQQSPSPGDGS